MRKIVIAIDGHSSCGKSTLARDLAKEFNYVFVDSGAMYRAVTLYLIENQIPINDHSLVTEALSSINISFRSNNQSAQDIFLNGRECNNDIRTKLVTDNVSPVATISSVRKFLVDQQRIYGNNKAIVMDGRDIGSVVFPEAELKLFLTASIDVRTNRRYKELQAKGMSISIEEIRANLIDRDRIDSSRKDSPLLIAEEAIVLDNSYLNKEEQFAMIKALVLSRTCS